MVEIAVLGGGSWGTALAQHVARCGHRARLLFRNPERAERVAAARINETYLPGVSLLSKVVVSARPEDAIYLIEGPLELLRAQIEVPGGEGYCDQIEGVVLEG